jgi:hypothetical protein
MINVHLADKKRKIDGDWDKLARMSLDEIRSYDIFCGHFGYSAQELFDSYVIFTFLRDPVQRAISYYNFIQRVEFHYMHWYAKELSLMEFARDDYTQPLISNAQARYILCDWPLENIKQSTSSDAELVRTFESYPLPPDDEALGESKSRLEEFIFVGISELFYLDVARLWKVMDWPGEINLPETHKSHSRVEIDGISPDVVDYLESINQVDRKLYEYIEQGFSS